MASGGRVYGGSNLPPIMLQPSAAPGCPPLDSFYLSGSPPPFLLGSTSMVSFEDVNGSGNSKRSLFRSFDQEEDEYDEYFNQSGKKRRLTVDQLKFLERSFEADNKLEPDRKLQLAKDLGLQPRQVAIWFQNRRARWKAKQMERDYDVLQASFNALKADYDRLSQEKEDLKVQISILSDEFVQKHQGTNMAEAPQALPPENPAAASISEESKQDENSTSPKNGNKGVLDSDSTSTKKREGDNMFDADSHYYISGVHSPHLEHVDSSFILEPDSSDLSQDEDDSLSRGFLPSTPYRLPKLEPGDYSLASSSTSRNFGFPVDDNAFWSWSF
uniref:Homeobox-leucine zipper protein n=1 Tax=Kalanchoe fedtschenkoi TaxID=63787 RepID=A0A7N0U0A7_KALFE